MLRAMTTCGRTVMGTVIVTAATALLSACLGVETYREGGPAPSLAIRLVADEENGGEVLPRWSGDTSEMLAVEPGIVVGAEHIRHVRLLDAADGSRVLVLDLDDEGRARLHETSAASIGRRLAVVVGGRVVAAPTIRNVLTEGEAYVTVPPAELERAFEAMSAPE